MHKKLCKPFHEDHHIADVEHSLCQCHEWSICRRSGIARQWSAEFGHKPTFTCGVARAFKSRLGTRNRPSNRKERTLGSLPFPMFGSGYSFRGRKHWPFSQLNVVATLQRIALHFDKSVHGNSWLFEGGIDFSSAHTLTTIEHQINWRVSMVAFRKSVSSLEKV